MNRAIFNQTTSSALLEQLEVQVTQYWGNAGTGNVIAQRHALAGTGLSLGEEGCDFTVPNVSHDLVRWDGEQLVVTPPLGSTVFIDRMMATSEAFPLNQGHCADVIFGEFTFHVEVAPREQRPVRAIADVLAEGKYGTFAGSAVAHAALLAAFAFFMPALSSADDGGVDRQRIFEMKSYLTAAAEREQETKPEKPSDDEQGGSKSDPGQRAQGAEGAMGGPKPVEKPGRWSAKGDSRPEDAQLAREHALKEAQEFGMIGLISSASSSDPNAPVVPWGNLLMGADRESHMGNLWSGDIGDAFGNGLGLTGNDEGGGGKGQGIGVGDVGGLGHMLGTCGADTDCAGGHGHGHGKLGGDHRVKSPKLTWDPKITTSGRLDAQVIQRIVRQNSGRFVACYQDGLRQNPSLTGRVAVQFMIGRDGTVTMAADTGGSDLPDQGVRQCVVKSFYGVSFPEPGGGTVRVVYPFTFTPE
ncbi:MAG TPA: AgmX/PglI C-terminal domain-containing protein [Polyangiaceae bacterium]|nr:AgmX/PglI C-terminal domain-containing protein [Polyangiaceae bacterium]